MVEKNEKKRSEPENVELGPIEVGTRVREGGGSLCGTHQLDSGREWRRILSAKSGR